MTQIEQTLAGLAVSPAADLERRTVTDADAGDLVARADSPSGPLWIAWSRSGITGLSPTFAAETFDEFVDRHRRVAYEADALPRVLKSAIDEALESGDSAGLTFDLRGISAFRQSVLNACATIPTGTVRSYGWIADDLRKPGATRAVGTALAKNPIPLLIPCHRVVRADGSIGNYAFGREMKLELLRREGALTGDDR